MKLWKQTLIFINSLCDVLAKFLPSFWKICKIYMDDNPSRKLQYENRAPRSKRVQDGQSMINNIFEIIQTMINYSFHLNEDEYASSDMLFEESESMEILSPSSASPLTAPNINSYITESEEDMIWKTFQVVYKSLKRIPIDPEINFLEAHPIMIVHFSTRIMEAFTEFQSDIKVFYTGDEGQSVMNSLSATIDTVKDYLVEKICQGWVKSIFILHSFGRGIFGRRLEF